VNHRFSHSYDPESGKLSFLWKQIQGKQVVPSDPSYDKIQFVTPIVLQDRETLVFRLTVIDEKGKSSEDTVSIIVKDNGIQAYPDDVISFKTATDKTMGIRISENAAFTELNNLDSSSIEDTTNRPWNLIYGIQTFDIQIIYRDTVMLTFYLPEKAWYKDRAYRLFEHSPEDGWKEKQNAVFNENRTRISVILKDGAAGDADDLQNGSISLTFALGIVYERNDGSPSFSHGCFINATF